MEATLNALGGILLRAVPTFILVVLLNFYFKYLFFKPMEKVLAKRRQATEGAKKAATESLDRAAAKAAEYESAIRTARARVYQAQEQANKALQEELSGVVAAGRASADAAVKQAKAELADDVAAAKQQLAADAEGLSGQIAESILRRSAA
jgi:F-type H+-transporting ATPase subunit b